MGKIWYFFEPPWVLKNKDEHEAEGEDDEDDIDENEDDITRLDDSGG